MGMRGPTTPADAFERQLKQNRLGTWLVLEDDAVTFGTAARAALEEDPLVDLNLPLLVAGGKTPTAQSTYLRERFGWSRGGHWALLDSSGSVLGEGATAPTPASLSAAADRAGVKSRAQELEAFLLLHGDHLEAQVALVRERINVACRRTRKVLGLAQPKATGPARPGANPSPVAAPPPPTAAAAAALPPEEPKPLDPELDQKVWGEAARLFGKLFQGPWQEAYSDLPMALNGPESVHSPAMQEAWTRCLPAIEEALRRQPSDEDLWRIWVIGSDLSGGRPLAPFMDSLAPLPGTARRSGRRSRCWVPLCAMPGSGPTGAPSRTPWSRAGTSSGATTAGQPLAPSPVSACGTGCSSPWWRPSCRAGKPARLISWCYRPSVSSAGMAWPSAPGTWPPAWIAPTWPCAGVRWGPPSPSPDDG